MACNNVYHGLNLRWGTVGLGSTAFGTSALIQSADIENQAEQALVKDQSGNTVARADFDFKDTATFEYVTAVSGSASGNATITKPSVGQMITVTDSVGAGSDLSGSMWIVDNASQKQMNTDACKISVKATRYCGITS